MGILNGTLAALAEGHAVRAARLVFFDFADGPMRLWEGQGDIKIGTETWRGAGELGSMTDLPVAINDSAGNMEFRLSGVSPEVIALARDAASVRGRSVTVYLQFFDLETGEPVDTKVELIELIMDTVTYSGTGPSDRALSLVAEPIWYDRRGSAFAYFSDKNQRKRFNGDRGLERIYEMTGAKRVTWPSFT